MDKMFSKYSIGILVIDSKARAHILDYRGKVWDDKYETKKHIFESPVFPDKQIHFTTIEDALKVVQSKDVLIEGQPATIDLNSIIIKEHKFDLRYGIVDSTPVYSNIVPTFI